MSSIYSTPIEHLQTLSSSLRAQLQEFKWSIESMMKLVQLVMETVETVKEIKGQDKKQLALDLMHYCVDHYCHVDASQKCELHAFIVRIVPTLIDTVVIASKGMVRINLNSSCCWN
jgi:predicted metalloenzyme YecM